MQLRLSRIRVLDAAMRKIHKSLFFPGFILVFGYKIKNCCISQKHIFVFEF